jgi:hypothetical protein
VETGGGRGPHFRAPRQRASSPRNLSGTGGTRPCGLGHAPPRRVRTVGSSGRALGTCERRRSIGSSLDHTSVRGVVWRRAHRVPGSSRPSAGRQAPRRRSSPRRGGDERSTRPSSRIVTAPAASAGRVTHRATRPSPSSRARHPRRRVHRAPRAPPRGETRPDVLRQPLRPFERRDPQAPKRVLEHPRERPRDRVERPVPRAPPRPRARGLGAALAHSPSVSIEAHFGHGNGTRRGDVTSPSAARSSRPPTSVR